MTSLYLTLIGVFKVLLVCAGIIVAAGICVALLIIAIIAIISVGATLAEETKEGMEKKK